MNIVNPFHLFIHSWAESLFTTFVSETASTAEGLALKLNVPLNQEQKLK